MIVMDADSVMAGETLVKMVAAMEKKPRVGILQTAPAVAGRETLLARVQQVCQPRLWPHVCCRTPQHAARRCSFLGP